jgi:hypothetical protein
MIGGLRVQKPLFVDIHRRIHYYENPAVWLGFFVRDQAI